MDWQIENTSVVIVGAGFSAAATDGRLPLMTGFFDRLKVEQFPHLYEFVKAVGCNRTCLSIAHANVERVLLTLDQIRTSPASVLDNWLGVWKDRVPGIHRQMSLYTLERLKAGLHIAKENWAASILRSCDPDTTVISMNYDNVAERILSNRPRLKHGDHDPTCPHCRMRILLERACSCATRDREIGESWRGSLLKLHGSIAWKRCLTPECCNYDCFVADRQCRPFEPCDCPYCGAECDPVLVLPTMSKNLAEMPEISTMWQAARLAMQNAESVLLFGFSLPASDELLLQLIRMACAKGKKLKRVASIDLDPEAVLNRFESCIPIDCEVETAALPVVKGEIPIWYQSIGNSRALLRITT